jgi:hypothetical protein
MPRKPKILENAVPFTASEEPKSAAFHKAIAEKITLYRDGDVTLAGMREGQSLRLWRLDSSAFAGTLRNIHFDTVGRPLGQNALADLKGMLEARASRNGKPCKAGLRFMSDEAAVYLDLCNDDWQVVRVTADGWAIEHHAEPPRFVRTTYMLPLPLPVQGGDLDELWKFTNIHSLDDRLLVLAWLMTALMGNRNTPLLALHGEQGSAKSTTTRILRELIDANRGQLRSLPSKEHELFVAAASNPVLTFDNMSGLNAGLSDGLCKIVTGGAFSTRRLYSDTEEVLLEARRPVIINGIDDLVTRQDLISRAVVVGLPIIKPEERLAEAAFYQAFKEAHPRLLGTLLTTLSGVLTHLPAVPSTHLPRMADYAQVGIALEHFLKLAEGTFIQTFQANQRASVEAGLESEPLVEALEQYLKGHQEEFNGAVSHLLAELNKLPGHEYRRYAPQWPKLPHHLSRQLKRLLPALRLRHISVTPHRRSEARWVHIKKEATPISVISVTNRLEAVNEPFPSDAKAVGQAVASPLASTVLTAQVNGSQPHDANDANSSTNG